MAARGLARAVPSLSVPDETPSPFAGVVLDIRICDIEIGPNVRATVGELDELVASIGKRGVLQPVRVRHHPELPGKYLLLWGQRRTLAARKAGLVTIPATVDVRPREGAALAIEQLVENLQRADLAPLEEARALRAVLDADPDLTQEALAAELGRSRPWLSNALRLLDAPPVVQDALAAGEISASHARSLVTATPAEALQLVKRTVDEGLTQAQLDRALKETRRQAEWQAERKAQDEQADARWVASAVASKAIAKAPAATLLVSQGERKVKALEKALPARKVVAVGFGDSQVLSAGVKCDCDALLLDTAWGHGGEQGVRVRRACHDKRHWPAINAEELAKQRAKRGAAEERSQRWQRGVEQALREGLAFYPAAGPALRVMRVLLRALTDNYRRDALNDDPEDLIGAIAGAVAQRLMSYDGKGDERSRDILRDAGLEVEFTGTLDEGDMVSRQDADADDLDPEGDEE